MRRALDELEEREGRKVRALLLPSLPFPPPFIPLEQEEKRDHSHEHILVEVIEVVLQLLLRHGAVGIKPRVLVDVGEEDGGGVDGSLMLSRAAVSVTTGSDLQEEGRRRWSAREGSRWKRGRRMDGRRERWEGREEPTERTL